MNDIEAHVVAYFKRQLSDAEMKQFEERCVHDAVFARQVALFISTEEGIRQQLLDEKKQQWRAISTHEDNKTIALVKKNSCSQMGGVCSSSLCSFSSCFDY